MYLPMCTPLSRNVVRGVFRAKQGLVGLTTADIYQTALQLYPDAKSVEVLPADGFGYVPERNRRKAWQMPPQPANPTHPIHSLRFLKKVVLEYMMAEKEIQKVLLSRSQERDADGHPVVGYKLKGGSERIMIPYEQRHPKIDGTTSVFLWRHMMPERLERDEPATNNDTAMAHMRFVDAQIPQQRVKERKARPTFGMAGARKDY